MKFKIEQLALYPVDPEAAIELLTDMGAAEWAHDHVVATGEIFGTPDRWNGADLNFNYELLGEAKELEVLHYTDGMNWMTNRKGLTPPRASHIGMHCTEEELDEWRAFFAERGIAVAQEVYTQNHTNPVIDGKRLYHYVIFDTYDILSIDVKFIIRRVNNEVSSI